MSSGFDPIKVVEEIRSKVTRIQGDVELRKYYRFRGSRFYGGSAVADAVGCNLRCGFCWSWKPNTYIDSYGRFYRPEEVATNILSIADRYGYRVVRISGGEPTISRRHLIAVLENVEKRIGSKLFVLETNGILIGYDKTYAEELSRFRFIHVRVSIKGCNAKLFSMLTGAQPQAFEYQLRALKNLLDYGVSTHPAVVASFCTAEEYEELLSRLSDIDPRLADEVEIEYIILYPHVVELMKRRGLRPYIAVDPKTWSFVRYGELGW